MNRGINTLMKKFNKYIISVFAAVTILFSSIAVSATEVNNSNKKDLVDTAIEAGQFTILAKALKAADLVDALKVNKKRTVFAPTDEAFKKLPKGTLETLLKPENKEKLRAILLYHVVDAKLSAKRVTKLDGRKIVTLQGGLLKVNADSGVKINGVNVIKADVKAQNGVIHVIDTVLLPE